MTDEIPPEIMREAERAMATLPKDFVWMKVSEAFSLAMMERDKRAAKIAHGWLHDNGYAEAAPSVALAILKYD